MKLPKYFYFRVNASNLELEDASNEDVVEVVRCGECKHCYVDGENVRYNVCDLNHNKVQSDFWFCADAERREP